MTMDDSSSFVVQRLHQVNKQQKDPPSLSSLINMWVPALLSPDDSPVKSAAFSPIERRKLRTSARGTRSAPVLMRGLPSKLIYTNDFVRKTSETGSASVRITFFAIHSCEKSS